MSSSELLKTGELLMEANRPDSALIYYISLSGKYQSKLSKQEKIHSLQGFIRAGRIYYEQGNYHNALDFYFKAFRICEAEEISDLLAEIYKDMGNIYNKFKDFERGKDFYLRGLALARESGDEEMQWKILNNLIGICCYGRLSDSDVKQAWDYYDQMKGLEIKNKDLKKYYDLLDLGYIYTIEEKLDSAINYYTQALDYAAATALDSRYISSSATELAFMYEDMDNCDLALQYHLFSEETSLKDNLVEMRLYSLQNLSVVYEKMGNEDKALQYRTKYLNLSDSIFNIREFNRIKNQQMVYEMEKVNEKVDILNSEIEESEYKFEMQKRISILISSCLLLFVVLLIVVTKQKKKLEKAYEDLFDRNKEILKSYEASRLMRSDYERKLKEEKEKNTNLRKELELRGFQDAEKAEPADELPDADTGKLLKLTDEQKDKLVSDINHIMENTLEFCDCDFNLNKLASLIGSNSKYVSQIINEVHNKNFRTYINKYRIEEACKRLMNTDAYGQYTIKAVAESVGYKSATTFILIFKQHTGINPSTYQKIAQKQTKTDFDTDISNQE